LERTGLVPKDLFFDEKETAVLHSAVRYTYENDGDLYYEINEKAPHLMEKLKRLAPQDQNERKTPACTQAELQTDDIQER